MRAPISVLVMLIGLAAAVASAPASTAACGPKPGGKAQVQNWCGPAKATVTWAGKTLTLKGGQCEVNTSLGDPYFVINAGTYTIPPAKPVSRAFSALQGTPAPLKAGTYSAWLISFQTPGRQWLFRSRTTKVTITAGAKTGTFSGTLDGGGKATGSWTC